MRKQLFLLCCLFSAASPLVGLAATPSKVAHATPARLTEADRKVTAGRILLKWGGYVEKVNGQNRKVWAARLWPSLAKADLDNLQKASRAVTYEGMRNALLGQRPYDDEIIDRAARTKLKAGSASQALDALPEGLVFTAITPCRIVDTRNPGAGGPLQPAGPAGVTRDLIASNPPNGNFAFQGGSNTDCGIPSNPAALALSVTALENNTTGFLRVFPANGTSAQGSPVPLTAVKTTVTNDIIVQTCQTCGPDLKVFSTANTHYAAFVTGYFTAPKTAPVECVSVSAPSSILLQANNVGTSTSDTCPAGYAIVSGECNTDQVGGRKTSNLLDEDLGADSYSCAVVNTGAVGSAPVSVNAAARCCRIPGG